MNLSLENKRAIVCGSTDGIGKEIAIKLSKQNANVTLLARNEKKLNNVLSLLDTSKKQKHDFIVSDFNNPDLLEKKINDYINDGNKPEILINNTGGPPPGKIIEAKKEDFDKYISMHLHCSHILVKALAPFMKKSEFGRIINIIGRGGHFPTAKYIAGGAINAAILNITQALAEECGPDNVLVNGINPAATATERWDTLVQQRMEITGQTEEQIKEASASSVPLGRIGKPEDIANMVVYLCSEKANFINGSLIDVDGGVSRAL